MSDGFRNRAAPVVIAGDPAGAHVTIDATGIHVYDSDGLEVVSLTPTNGLIATSDDAEFFAGNLDSANIEANRTGVFVRRAPDGVQVIYLYTGTGDGEVGAQTGSFNLVKLPAHDLPDGGPDPRLILDATSSGSPAGLAVTGDGLDIADISTAGQVSLTNGGVPILSGAKGTTSVLFTGFSNNAVVNLTWSLPAAPTVVLCSMGLIDLNPPVFGVGTPTATGATVVITRRDGATVSGQFATLAWVAIL